MNEIQGSSIVILGYGREGQSVESWVKKHHPEISVRVADKAKDPKYLSGIRSFDTVVRSPGVSPFQPEIVEYLRYGGHVTSSTNIFFSLVPGMTIGVTGTKGKSTTAALIAHILSQQFPDVRLVGNIGRPTLDHLDSATKETIFVVELSSHQLEDIRYSPHIAVVLGIVPEHLDYYPNFDAYAEAKGNIVRFQKANDAVVFNPEHKLVSSLVKESKARKVAFEKFSFSNSVLKGNRENILAAVTVAKLLGVSDQNIRHALTTFTPLPHRLEFVGAFRGIRFYNDSLSTIPEATIHGLEALGPRVETLIAGGFDRGLDFAKLGEYLSSHPVKTLILFPDTGERIWKVTEQAMQARPATRVMQKYDVTTMKEAVNLAYEHTAPGKICLLSPASASFNLFKNYEDRGEQFKEWVKNLGMMQKLHI